MAYTSLDPRENIRTIIGTSKAVNPNSWNEQYVLSITHKGTPYNIPIYLCEESHSTDLPSLPFIDLNLLRVSYVPHNVGATTRKCEAYVDVGFYFTANDNIDPATFGKGVMDEIINNTRSKQETCSFGVSFLNIKNIRLLKEGKGKQVIYHYVLELYGIYYD